jgi:hypothetical protein
MAVGGGNLARRFESMSMKVLRDASAHELDELFREATVDAAKKALKDGLSVTGLDPDGRLVAVTKPLVVPPDAQPDPAPPPNKKNRSRGVA